MNLDLKACVVCLHTGVKLLPLDHGETRKLYELILGLQLQEEAFIKLPNFICYICLAHFRRFKTLREKCTKSYLLLQELYTNGKLTNKYLSLLDLQAMGLNSPICLTTILTFTDSDAPILFTSGNKVKEECIDEDDTEPSANYDDYYQQDDTNDILIRNEPEEILITNQVNQISGEPNIETVTVITKNKQIKKKGIKKNILNNLDKHFHKYFTQKTRTQHEQYQKVLDRQKSIKYMKMPFKCEVCFTGFVVEDKYLNHMVVHDPAESGQFQCDMCKTCVRLKRVLRSHIHNNHLFNYSCKKCSYECVDRAQAKKHIKWHQRVIYNCGHCDKTFPKYGAFMAHKRIMHPSNIICRICGFNFVTYAGLTLHLKRSHTVQERKSLDDINVNPDDSLFCKRCNIMFMKKEGYLKHLKNSINHVTVKEDPYEDIRQARTIIQSKVEIIKPGEAKTTELTKVKEKIKQNKTSPITTTCDCCGKTFRSEYQALKHYRAEHPDYRPYICDICGIATKTVTSLLNHNRIHTKEQPYQCPVCQRRFSQKTNYNRHMGIHQGDKRILHDCDICGKGFTTKTIRKLHVRTVHDKIPYIPWVKNSQRRKAKRAAFNNEIIPFDSECGNILGKQ